MKKFINDPFMVVEEMLDGFTAAHESFVRRHENGYTILRKDVPVKDKVGVVIGGGSGHKPALIGYIGRGFVDAVAVGDVFTSPPARLIVDAAKSVDSGAGVIFLVGNYAGDMMNFQIALDLLTSEGHKVATAVGTDDIASAPSSERHKRRGVSGMVFTWKCVGAAAEAGATLEKCLEIATLVNHNTATIGVASSPCIVPAKGTPTFTLAEDELEYGVGHHGEAGVERIKMLPARALVSKMMDDLLEDTQLSKGDRVAVMVNGLGSTPLLELYIVFKHVKEKLNMEEIHISRSLVGNYFTGLGMGGFSITLFKLTPELEEYLSATSHTPHGL